MKQLFTLLTIGLNLALYSQNVGINSSGSSPNACAMSSMRYNDLIAITIKAVQERQQIILDDKEKIKLLENRLKALE